MYKTLLITLLLGLSIAACQQPNRKETAKAEESKAVVYQVFTRLFGNTNNTNKAWGTLEENGIGKFNDFTDKALLELKDLGVTHMWYTGVPHHAVIRDYSPFGISNDDPDVVKGRAGSPYAVKDYYNVNPDLAVDPANRLEEFKALIERTHKHGMKVLIDIVPNHVARQYEGKNNPEGVTDFGFNDDTSVEYAVNNNFYYIPEQAFKVPISENNYQPLGGEYHPKADGQFDENPAKWTGNGSRLAQPNFHDWYETVKINYGVRPDGKKDFDNLPKGFNKKDYKAHYTFWQDKIVPDSWLKFHDIVIYWTNLGVDGFRFDMAEMVPVEFWSFLNSSIKTANPDAFLLAEVYNPSLYRDYIHLGKMDYLYDKVELYDTLKHIMQGHGLTDNLVAIQNGLKDIEHHMLHFLENHDEQRIASPEFAGNAKKGMPAMVVSTTISTAPTMLYFGQEVGETGAENAGFGSHSRTSIFDYIGVPHHQRWMNNGAFDGGLLLEEEKTLRDFYKRLLNFSTRSKATMGHYQEIHSHNRKSTEGYSAKVFSFARWSEKEHILILSNFNDDTQDFRLQVPSDLIKKWELSDGHYNLSDQLYGTQNTLKVIDGIGYLKISLKPLESFIYQVQ